MLRWASIVALMTVAACSSGPPCRAKSDCETGSYCQIDISGSSISGTCVHDCVSKTDCGGDPGPDMVSFCSDEGRCVTTTRRPRLRVTDPEHDSLLDDGTRKIRLTGHVETAAESVKVTVSPLPRDSCVVGVEKSIVIHNPDPGTIGKLPFIVNDIELDPGFNTLTVRADIGTAEGVVNHLVEIPCAGCAKIGIDTQATLDRVPGLVLPRLRGTVAPATVRTAAWRIRNELGDVFDGPLSVTNGAFDIAGLPLFAGTNRLQVVVSGVGDGLGVNRCSRIVLSGIARERGLRAILTWDGQTSDLDLHIVGPGGTYGSLTGDLHSRSPKVFDGSTLVDDFDGLGPEMATIETLADGVYGVVIEPILDGRDPGSDAILRILYDGRPVSRGPIGPKHLSYFANKLWVVGTLAVVDGNSTWTYVNELLDLDMPPTRTPDAWTIGEFY